eukprot:COSAG01_NODE_5964_length_3930_cov_3.327852_4_plen_46_part_01
MLGGFTRSLSALVHFTLHTGAGVDSVVYTHTYIYMCGGSHLSAQLP